MNQEQNGYPTYTEDGNVARGFDYERSKRDLSSLGISLAVFTVTGTVIATVLAQLVATFFPKFASNVWVLNAITPVALYLFALPLMLILLPARPNEPSLEKKKLKPQIFLLYFIIGMGLMQVGARVGNTFMAVFSGLTGFSYQNGIESLVDTSKPINLLATAIFVCAVAPIAEEFIFRKLIIDRTRRHGDKFAILFSAFAFALMHGNFYQMFYAFALGLLLGYIYTSTGKLRYVIFLHAAINFCGSILPVLMTSGLEELILAESTADINELAAIILAHLPQIILIFIYSSFLLACAVLSMVLPAVLRKKLSFSRGTQIIPRGMFARTLESPGVIVMFAIYVALLAISLIP